MLLVESNTWNGSNDGLFAFTVNNSVSISNVNYGALGQ